MFVHIEVHSSECQHRLSGFRSGLGIFSEHIWVKEVKMTINFLRNLLACGLLTLISGGLLFSPPLDHVVEEATPRPTLTPSPTQIPLPERPETLADIQTLLQEVDQNCHLPCFWGFIAGHTTEEEVIEFLQPVAIGNNAPELQYVFRQAEDEDPIFWLSFGITGGVVSTTYVTLENPSEWLPPETLELPNLLSIMTSVPTAYLDINITTRRVFITLAYEEGVFAEYAFELHSIGESLAESDFQFCPVLDENYLILLRLRNGNIDSLLRGARTPLETMTGTEVKDFVEQIIENPDECIDLPSYAELLEMGYEF